MANHKMNTVWDGEYAIEESNGNWMFGANSFIKSTFSGIEMEDDYTGNTIVMNGQIMADHSGIDVDATDLAPSNTAITVGGQIQADLYGIAVEYASAPIVIGKTGVVTAGEEGIYVNEGTADIANHGRIIAQGTGIYANGGVLGGSAIVNSGVILAGDDGINLDGADSGAFSIVNEKSGVVSAGDDGINTWSNAAETFTITNAGRITAHDHALSGGEGAELLTNTGRIAGSINLGDGANSFTNRGMVDMSGLWCGTGDDVLVNRGTIGGASILLSWGNDHVDTRGGTLDIENLYLDEGDDIFDARWATVSADHILGGSGNDTYLVSGTGLALEEGVGEGFDTVKSTVSYVLGSALDNLTLLGSGNTRATGNDLSNTLKGNGGNNVLKGMGSFDILNGGGGNDRLFGGDGVDLFAFVQGCDKDQIKDFADGTDVIVLQDYNGISSFADLEIRKFGDHAIIELAGGDSIEVFGAKKSQLTVEDFLL